MAESSATTIRHFHGGVEWDIPADVFKIRSHFAGDYAECARQADGVHQVGYGAACRRRVIALRHFPWMVGQMAQRRQHQADTALKDLACRVAVTKEPGRR